MFYWKWWNHTAVTFGMCMWWPAKDVPDLIGLSYDHRHVPIEVCFKLLGSRRTALFKRGKYDPMELSDDEDDEDVATRGAFIKPWTPGTSQCLRCLSLTSHCSSEEKKMRMYNFKAWAELPIVRNHKGEPLVRVRQTFTYRTILADRQKAMKRIQARKAKETAQATAQATKGKRASSTAAKPAPKKASRVNATPGPSRRPTRQRTTVPSDEDESDDNAAPATSTPRRSRRRTRKPSPHPPAEDESDDDAAHSRTAPTPGPSRRRAREPSAHPPSEDDDADDAAHTTAPIAAATARRSIPSVSSSRVASSSHVVPPPPQPSHISRPSPAHVEQDDQDEEELDAQLAALKEVEAEAEADARIAKLVEELAARERQLRMADKQRQIRELEAKLGRK